MLLPRLLEGVWIRWVVFEWGWCCWKRIKRRWDTIVKIKGEKEIMMMMRWWRELFDAYLVAQ